MPETFKRFGVWLNTQEDMAKLHEVQKQLQEQDGLKLTLQQVGRYLIDLGYAQRIRNQR